MGREILGRALITAQYARSFCSGLIQVCGLNGLLIGAPQSTRGKEAPYIVCTIRPDQGYAGPCLRFLCYKWLNMQKTRMKSKMNRDCKEEDKDETAKERNVRTTTVK